MYPIVTTKTLATADPNGISLSQTPLAAGNLTITGAFASGGVATLDTGRKVIITSAADDSGRTFTIYGSLGNNAQVEAVTGASAGVAASLLDFDKITRISVDAATAGAVEVGTNGVGQTPWVLVDGWANPTDISVAVVVTGTVNFDILYTYNRYWLPAPQPNTEYPVPPVVWTDPVLNNETASGETTFSFPVSGICARINSGSGSIELTVFQAGGGR